MSVLIAGKLRISYLKYHLFFVISALEYKSVLIRGAVEKVVTEHC